MVFWGKKKTEISPKVDDRSNSPLSELSNDLVGAEDWKKSKFGYLTGFSPAKRAVASIGSAAKDSTSRTRSLATMLFSQPDVAGIENHEAYSDYHEKFLESQRVHRLSASDLKRLISNTYRAGRFYIALSAINLVVTVGLTVYSFSELSFRSLLNLGPLPLLMALAFRNLYTNWMARNQVLAPISVYFSSKDWFPKIRSKE